MTIQKVSFRDFLRGLVPSDVVVLFGKRSKKSKGLYISPQYADDVLSMIQQKEKEKQEKKRVYFWIL